MPQRTILLILATLLVATAPAKAKSISCPAADPGLAVQGPYVSSNDYGRTQLTCRYYDRQHKKASIEVYFYGDYRKPRDCSSRVYANAHFRSWDFQVYGFIWDDDVGDFLTKKYWQKIAKGLVKQAEQRALPCVEPKRIPPVFNTPIRKSKPKQYKSLEEKQSAETILPNLPSLPPRLRVPAAPSSNSNDW